MRDEIQNAAAAIHVIKKDSRLGFHQEAQAFFFDVSTIEVKLRNMEHSLMR